MNMAVASRRSALAMVRALGARRGQLVGDMLGEAAFYGFLGGLIGIPVGILAGRWAISRLPEMTLNPSVRQSTITCRCSHPSWRWRRALPRVAATALAARTVFSVSPVEAMSAAGGDVDKPPSRPVVAVAAVGGLVGIAASWVLATSVPGRTAIIAGAVFRSEWVVAVSLAHRTAGARGDRSCRPIRCAGTLAAVNTARASRRVWATVMTVAVAIAVGMGTSGALQNLVSSLGVAAGPR